jgi:integrase
LSLAFFDRSDRVYLWIAALLLMVSADNASGTMAVWTQWVNSTYDNVSHNVFLFSLYYAGWVMVWRQETADLIGTYLSTRADECPALFISERRSRLSVRAIQQTFTTWCLKLGLKRFHIHQLRHSFATRLANADIDALVLRELMGHERFETTTRYFRLAEDTKARQYFSAMESLRALK